MRGLGSFARDSAANSAASSTRRSTALLVMAAMVVPSLLGAVAPAWAAPVGVPVRFIAVYDDFGSIPANDAFLAQGATLEYRLLSIPGVVLVGPEGALANVAADPHVQFVERDGPQEYFLETATFATNAADVWGEAWWPVPSEVQRKAPSPLRVDGEVIDGTGVVVGVVDSGINALNPDLWWAPGHVGEVMPWEPKVIACLNIPEVIAQLDQPYCDETVGHGTHVAGIVAGNGWAARNGFAPGMDPDAPPIGAAPGAQLVGFGLGAGLFIVNGVEALDWVAAHHADYGLQVVTNSWGGAGSCTNVMPASTVNAISNVLIDGGVPVVFANGNYDIQGNPTWSSPHAINPKPGLISVANYNDQNSGSRDGAVAGGSSDGCAGSQSTAGDLLWTWPDVSAPGTSITSTAAYTGTLIPPLDGGFYGTAGGTSMAAPHVAGIIALMKQANPDLTPAQVERVLIETATPYSDGTSARGITGTAPMWGSAIANNPLLGFSDKGACKVTPTDAAKAEAGDTSVNTKFPSFTTLATRTDADLYVCRDFKRGRGLVDAYAAVQRAILLRGDDTGSPEVTITSPADGAQVDAGIVQVAGLVDRAGGSNVAPTAGLSADAVSGSAPLAVSFTLAGSDTDGTIASWSLDFDDGSAAATGASLPTMRSHTYDSNGEYTARLTVTDNGGATGEATVAINVGGLPIPDGSVTGLLFFYNGGPVGIGVSNVAAIATGTLGDPVPKHVAGELISAAARNVLSADAGVPVTAATPAQFMIFDPDGAIVYGPVQAVGAADPGLTGDCTSCTRFDPPDFQIPVDFAGRYYMGYRLTILGQPYFIFDSDFSGLKPFDVIGPGSLAAEPPIPLTVADLDGRAFPREDAPIAFGSREDPEAEDPPNDPQGDLAFMDVLSAWVGLETDTTFDMHLRVRDLEGAPPTVNVQTPAGAARVSVNYGLEFCLDNNQNHASGDGLFCYRLSAVNSVTGAAFSGGVIQQDTTASCGLSGLVESGQVDVANDTVSWRLLKAGFDVTDNGANLAECTSTPIVRGGNPVREDDVLSLLEGSTGFTAGARVIATFAQGGDTSDPGNSRPYTFGQADLPLSVEAGGPYSGMAGAAIGIGAAPSGGRSPYDCTWSGPGTFANPDACVTTVTFGAPGTFTATASVQDVDGDTATDTATIVVGSSSGERVELFVDNELSPRTSVAVSTSQVSPQAAWGADLDLSGLEGPHTLTAKWLDADDTLLDSAAIGISVRSSGGQAFVTIDTPADDPSGGAPVSGAIAVSGEAGHATPLAMGEGLNAAGLPKSSGLQRLKATVKEGHILAPCADCQGSQATDPDLGTSATWLFPGPETAGVDGFWFDVAGFEGASYVLDSEFGSPMDVWFFVGDLDPQSAATGSKVGPAMPKTGTVPAGSNWAFVYIRRPTAQGVQDLQGFDDTAILSLTPNIVPPSAPQLFQAVPGPELVALNWMAPMNNGGEPPLAYKVYRDGALLTTLPGTSLAHTDDGLVAGQSYSYEVSAVNSAGEGAKAGPVAATPLPDTTTPLAITSPANGATGIAPSASLAGTYGPRGEGDDEPGGNFANTYYFFLMNLNNQQCSADLGHGDILIASKLWFHALNVLGVPDANLRFFNENGSDLCRADDPGHHDQLPPEWQSPNNPFDGPAKLSPFTASLRQAAEAGAASEDAGGPPARIFILQSSHGFWSPQVDHVTGSEMALNGQTVTDREFGDAITAALEDAEAGTDVSIEVAILVDCSFCGGFGDSPFWMPGTTTTAVDSAKVVGPNRVVEVGCTWITECFGNPAETYHDMFNRCTFTGAADGWGPIGQDTGLPHPLPDGSGDLIDDFVIPSATHHAKDGAITMEEAYWCALDSARDRGVSDLDPIPAQQIYQLIDQMDGDMFGSDGFVLWDINQNLDLPNRDPGAPLPPRNDLLPRTTSNDEAADGVTPFGDFLTLDATHTATRVVLDFTVTSLAHATAEFEDVIEYRVIINDAAYGICHDLGGLAVYDYTAGGYLDPSVHAVAYDFAANEVHVEIDRAVLADSTMPANVFAESRITNCTTAHLPQNDDRIPDSGTISTGTTIEPPVGDNEVRLSLDGPGDIVVSGKAVLDPDTDSWVFDPVGDLAQGTYLATAEHWFDDGSGFVRVEGPVSTTFTVGSPDTTPPSAPGTLVVTGKTHNTASLAWGMATDNVGVTGYEMYRSGAPGVALIPANRVGTTASTTFTDTGLAASTTYHYRVLAVDGAGNRGPGSNEVSVTTDPAPPVSEDVTLTIDGNFFRVIVVDTLGGTDPALWSTDLDTTTLTNGMHTLLATYDDGRGGSATDTARFLVSNGVSLAITTPTDGASVGTDIDVAGTASGAPPGASVQLRATNGGGTVRDWANVAFNGASWAASLDGMPFRALTIEARLRSGTSTLATDSVDVHVFGNDLITITRADGLAVGDQPVGPLDETFTVEGTSSLAPEADPRPNIPPVAVITNPVVLGRSITASGQDSYDADGTIVAWSWALGDGATRSGPALAYGYSTAGEYTVTLTVTDDDGATDQASYGPFTTTVEPPSDLAVDAGDSQFVAIGTPLALSAAAYGAVDPVRFAWDTDGDGSLDRNGQTLQVSTAGRSEGGHLFTAAAVDAVGAAGQDTVKNFLYQPITRNYHFEELNVVGLPDEQAGVTGLDQGNKVYEIEVPPGAASLDVFLSWTVYAGVIPPGAPGGLEGGPNDYDLYVFGPGGFSIASADFNMPEEVHLVGPAPGTWTIEVRPFLATPDIFTLDITVGEAPPNPVPKGNQVSEVCFEGPTQLLEATASVATGDAIFGAWDLDLDGAFDDATGFTAETTFPQDGLAHLVRFRATTSQGYRSSVTIGVRPSLDCPDAPSFVVVGVSDSGINPYNRDFQGSLLPDAKIRAYTTADSEVLLPDDAPVYISGVLQPFTKHPSRYIPGFPADAEPLELTLGAFNFNADRAEVWDRGHSAIALGKWYWIPGTKIIGAIDTTDSAAVNSAGDVYPIFDEDGHGTASASTAVGNFAGSCPRCLLAFAEGLSGDTMFFGQSWIDFVTVSGGAIGNIGTPGLTDVSNTRDAAERGQTISYAAGNGVDLSFLTPEQTYLGDAVGPDWNIRVGAVSQSTNSVVHGTGKPVDWSSYGSGNIPAACENNYNVACQHSGTSAATPISTGHLGSILLAAREALGDTLAGQKTPAQAGGVRQAIAVGSPVAGSPWLSDGVLQRHELWNVAFHCASQFGTAVGFPGSLPRSQVDYIYGGYGIADLAMQNCAKARLLLGGTLTPKPDADAFYEVDEYIRDHLWGDWDGDGNGEVGGNHNRPDSPTLPTPVQPPAVDAADLVTDSQLTRLWIELLGPEARAAPGYQETYFPHHRGGCDAVDGGEDYMDMTNHEEDFDGCGVSGTPPIFGETVGPSIVWPSEVASEGFASGAAVTGTLYLDYSHPGAPIVQVALLANGDEVARSPELQPVAVSPGFGIGPFQWTAYALDFVTTAPIPEGSFLELQLFVTGSDSVFVGYDGDHASRFTLTGTGGSGDLPSVAITAPAQGAEFDKADGGSTTVAGTSANAVTIEVAVDDPTFTTGLLSPSGVASWTATWNFAGAAVGDHTLYARACNGTLCSPLASRGVRVVDSDAPEPRAGSVEVQAVPQGQFPAPGAWVPATSHDQESGDWSYDWETEMLPNGVWDFHARLVADDAEGFLGEVARDVAQLILQNVHPPTLAPIGARSGIEGNLLEFGLSATDPDPDELLVFSATGLPLGATFVDHGDRTATFSWTPGMTQAGTYAVTFSVTDGQSTRSEQVTITIATAVAIHKATGETFAAIQAALDAAEDGYEIYVFPGEYQQRLDIAKPVVLCASPVKAKVGLTCGPNSAAVTLSSTDGTTLVVRADDVTVQGFTLRVSGDSGNGESYVLDVPTSLLVRNLRVQDNDIAPSDPGDIVAENGVRGLLRDARIIGNTFSGWTAAVYFRPYGGDNRVEENAFTDNLQAIQVASPGTRVERNHFFEGARGVIVSDNGDPDSFPSGTVLRDNLFALSLVHGVAFTASTTGVTVDARWNDWSVYEWRLVQLRVDEGNGNTVLLLPFKTPSGQEPPPPVVVGGHHCGGAGFQPLTLEEALGCAHLGLNVYLRPSMNPHDPTPYYESNVVEFNSEGERLDGITICSAPIGVFDCDHPVPRATVLQGREAPALTIRTDGVTLRGLSFAGQGPAVVLEGPAQALDAAENHWGAYRLSEVEARILRGAGDLVEVVPFLDTDATTPILPPVAAFAADRVATDRLTPVQLTDLSTPGGRPIATWAWTFGDGATSAEQHPAHTYAQLGTFTVQLRVENGAELAATAPPLEVTVVNLVPRAQFEFPGPSTRVDPTPFTDLSADLDGDIVAWHWEFGDGATSDEPSPEHLYSDLGTFTVRLTVTDSDGATHAAERSLTVVNLVPQAEFAYDEDYPMVLKPVTFTDLTEDLDGDIVSWAWDFGDGGTADTAEATHVFLSGGWHNVTLTVEDNDGGVSSAVRSLWVCAPGVNHAALLELDHFRLEFDACLRVTDLA